MKDHTIKLADVLFGEENRSFFDFLKYCFYGIFIYLNIQIELMTILAGLMALDTISGIDAGEFGIGQDTMVTMTFVFNTNNIDGVTYGTGRWVGMYMNEFNKLE